MTLNPPASHYFISQRLRLHYLDWGNASAPPLLLLHGGRDHCRNWDWTVQQLREHWHVLTPDLRGHGDSQWSLDGQYSVNDFVYDLAALIEQLQLAPLTLVGHSLGGNICVRYSGIFPDKVRKLVSIEGLDPAPKLGVDGAEDIASRMQRWIVEQHQLATRVPRHYASLDEAQCRMQEQNPHLSSAQARHLTEHGVRQNADGSYSWKFDNHFRSRPPGDLTREQLHTLWGRITCPTLLIYGNKSWASNPQSDGRAARFNNARVVSVDDAGHWLHHDQPQVFMNLLTDFL